VLLALLLAVPAAATAAAAGTATLDQALAAAQAQALSVAEADAEAEAAAGRTTQAEAASRPSLSVGGTIGVGWLDPRGFFGLQGERIVPRAAQSTLEQPLFTGGRAGAAIAHAKAGERAAAAGREAARAQLPADVASAYGAVLVAEEQRRLYERLVADTRELVRQAGLRFKVGESPRTDISQASARLAEAEAGIARADGELMSARARLDTLTGFGEAVLAPLPPPPPVPANLSEAVDAADAASPAVAQARAAADAASASVRLARAERMPTVGAFAEASTVADQFFPNYRADGFAVGVRARWQILDGGRTTGRIAEAGGESRAAEARLRAARDRTREAVVAAYQAVRTAQAVMVAAGRQAEAAGEAVDNVRHEVRVGEKPQIDLLDAQREALAASVQLARAKADRVVSAYRLNALLGRY
jgi:outer membrane protein